MALSHFTKVFAVTDCKIKPMTADPDGGTATYGTSIDVPAIKSVKISGSVETKSLRGDNTLLDSDAVISGVEVELEHGKLSLDMLAALMGGTVADSGTTPAQIATWTLTKTAKPKPFSLEAVSASADPVAGNVKFELHKLVLSSFPDLGLTEEDYTAHTLTAAAMPRLADGKWLTVSINETAATLT